MLIKYSIKYILQDEIGTYKPASLPPLLLIANIRLEVLLMEGVWRNNIILGELVVLNTPTLSAPSLLACHCDLSFRYLGGD